MDLYLPEIGVSHLRFEFLGVIKLNRGRRPQDHSHRPKRNMSKMKATFWDKRSKKYDDDIKKHDSIYVKTIDSTKSLLTHSDVVLDFACASGEMSFDIGPHVQRVHGIDPSVKMIELANQKARARQVDNITFDNIDAFDQRLESHSFSAIIAFNIFHLLNDAPRVLARLNDLLPTGRYVKAHFSRCTSEVQHYIRMG